MSEDGPRRSPDAGPSGSLLSPAHDRLNELEATDLAARALTKAEITKLADELLALVSEGSGA
jgi:hypothetical protein